GRRFGVVLTLLLFAASCLVVSSPADADPVSPAPNDRQIVFAVTSLLKREHLLKHPLDDEISRRSLELYLKALDPWKVYFYQSDIDAFSKYQDQLDDMARNRDLSAAYAIYKVFLERVDQRVQTIESVLAQPVDLTQDDEMIVDKDAVGYPANEAEALARWQQRVKYDLLSLKSDKIEGQEAIDKLKRRYQSFAKRMHQTDSDELLEMYLNSMLSAFDPHTSYMSPSTLDNFEIAMRLELEGIGAALQSVDGYTVIKSIIPGGAAEKDGRLKEEDRIVGVGQGPEGEIVDTVDMKLNDVVKLIRGKEGTVVRLAVMPVGSTDRKIYDIIRAKIELKDSEARGEVFEAGQKPDGSPYKVGVIDLPSFYMDMAGAKRGLPDYRSTTRDVKAILDGFNQKGVDAVILDLRRNGGGSLTEAINTTGLFIQEGPVVQVKDPDGRVQPFYDLDPSEAWAGPLVVLTSKFSASASEILAGAIQDYGRGLVVGDHSTHGKGTVQSLLDIGQQLFRIPNPPAMGALKITMQQFYRPNGESTQKRGVLADIEWPSLTTHLDVGESDLDFPVSFDKVDPLSFSRYGLVNPGICEQLRRQSEARCAQSDDFQKVRKSIERYLEQKARKSVTLNEDKFLKERAELNAEKEEEKKFEELSELNQNGIVRDFYLDEALAIATDYLNLRQTPGWTSAAVRGEGAAARAE
ncbi:MAG: carboxy terminal-processing peptidase, partial [Planctomycetota bacterium]